MRRPPPGDAHQGHDQEEGAHPEQLPIALRGDIYDSPYQPDPRNGITVLFPFEFGHHVRLFISSCSVLGRSGQFCRRRRPYASGLTPDSAHL